MHLCHFNPIYTHMNLCPQGQATSYKCLSNHLCHQVHSHGCRPNDIYLHLQPPSRVIVRKSDHLVNQHLNQTKFTPLTQVDLSRLKQHLSGKTEDGCLYSLTPLTPHISQNHPTPSNNLHTDQLSACQEPRHYPQSQPESMEMVPRSRVASVSSNVVSPNGQVQHYMTHSTSPASQIDDSFMYEPVSRSDSFSQTVSGRSSAEHQHLTYTDTFPGSRQLSPQATVQVYKNNKGQPQITPPTSNNNDNHSLHNFGINLEQYISKRNERERSRVRNVNDAFDNLKSTLPLEMEKLSKRMSKVEILRSAIDYIKSLEHLLDTEQQQTQQRQQPSQNQQQSVSQLSRNFTCNLDSIRASLASLGGSDSEDGKLDNRCA